jgi:hypothetical protein
MSQTYAQKIEKAKAQQAKARLRAKEKMNSPEFRLKQKEKAITARAKTIEKQSTPEYRAKQKEKAVAAATRAKAKAKAKPIKNRTPIKSKGLAGNATNKGEKSLHDKMAAVGCIACINAGLSFDGSGSYVSIHHCNGRTKKQSHEESLGLCQWHHDTAMTKEEQAIYPDVFPFHAKGSLGGKKAWEKVNGTQEELIVQLWSIVGYTPIFSNLLCTNK